jgi:hypothetical protein
MYQGSGERLSVIFDVPGSGERGAVFLYTKCTSRRQVPRFLSRSDTISGFLTYEEKIQFFNVPNHHVRLLFFTYKKKIRFLMCQTITSVCCFISRDLVLNLQGLALRPCIPELREHQNLALQIIPILCRMRPRNSAHKLGICTHSLG